MKMLPCALALAVAVLTFVASAQPQTPPSTAQRPVYEVLRTTVPIKIDGLLDDSAWTKAPTSASFLNNRDASPSSLPTEAWALYDDNFIYFASRFKDDNVWATMKDRDDHLWTEEVFEVFLQADPSATNYIELEVNPLGTLLDIYLLDIRKFLPFKSWNSEKIQWAVKVNGIVDGKPGDTGWTCEIAFPLQDVIPAPQLPPKPGDRWRVNMYRVDKLPGRASLAWSPTGSDFHRPDMFGDMVFTDRRVP